MHRELEPRKYHGAPVYYFWRAERRLHLRLHTAGPQRCHLKDRRSPANSIRSRPPNGDAINRSLLSRRKDTSRQPACDIIIIGWDIPRPVSPTSARRLSRYPPASSRQTSKIPAAAWPCLWEVGQGAFGFLEGERDQSHDGEHSKGAGPPTVCHDNPAFIQP